MENENHEKFTVLKFARGEMLLSNAKLKIHKTTCKHCRKKIYSIENSQLEDNIETYLMDKLTGHGIWGSDVYANHPLSCKKNKEIK